MPGSYDNTLMPDNSQPIKPDEIPVDDKGRPLPDPTESLSGYIIPSSVDMLKKAYSEVEEDEEVKKTMEPPQRTGFFKKHRPGKRGYDYYGIQSENIPDDGNGLNPSPLSQLFSEAEALETDFDADEIKNKIITPPQQMAEKVETPKQMYVSNYENDEDDILKKAEVIKDPNAPSFLDIYKESTNTKVIFQSDLSDDSSSNDNKIKSFETEKIFAEHSKLSNAKNKIKKKEEKRALKAALKLEKKKAKERKKAEKAARKAAKGKKGKNIPNVPNNTDNTFNSDIILTAPKEEPSNNQKDAEKAAAEAAKRFEQERIAAQKEKEQAAINLQKEKEAARIAREEAEKLKAELEKMKQEAAQAIAQKEKAEEAARLAEAEKEKANKENAERELEHQKKAEEESRSEIESDQKLRKEPEEAKAAVEQTPARQEKTEDSVRIAVSKNVKKNISTDVQEKKPEKDNNSHNNEEERNVYSFRDIPISKNSDFYKSRDVNADDKEKATASSTEKESLKINKDSIMSRKNKNGQ